MPSRDAHTTDSARLQRELARLYGQLNWELFGERLSPAPLVLSDDRTRFGLYVSDPRRIEISRPLLLEKPWGVVAEVLKHEMAHQFVIEVLGHRDEPSHGPSFRSVCERLGIDARATGLPDAADHAERSPILERIRKLLALAGSPNQHEAETAMRMAHRLMLKHNLQHAAAAAEGTIGYGFRHLGRETGRISEAESLLAALLGEFFFVQPIWIHTYRVADRKRASILEVTGRHENLVMAEYVHGFLLHAAESLWREHKRARALRGNADRRAFVAGVMRGFADKLRTERTQQAEAGLVWVGDPLAHTFFRRRHPKIRHSGYRSSARTEAGSHGRAAGRSLVMNRPLEAGASGEVRALRG
jgi:predicted SprT family Zn-dependent metalloprotease